MEGSARVPAANEFARIWAELTYASTQHYKRGSWGVKRLHKHQFWRAALTDQHRGGRYLSGANVQALHPQAGWPAPFWRCLRRHLDGSAKLVGRGGGAEWRNLSGCAHHNSPSAEKIKKTVKVLEFSTDHDKQRKHVPFGRRAVGCGGAKL